MENDFEIENKGLMNVLKMEGVLGVSKCIERVLKVTSKGAERIYRALGKCRVNERKIEKSFKIWGRFLKILSNQGAVRVDSERAEC